MKEASKSELLSNEIINGIESMNDNTVDIFNVYKELSISFYDLNQSDFEENFDYLTFVGRRQLIVGINKSELMTLNYANSNGLASTDNFQIKCSLLMMLSSLKERFNFRTFEFI